MEEQQPKTGKYALNYGLILGLISVVFSVFLYLQKAHYEQNWAVTGIGFLIMVVVVAIAVKNFRKANGDFLSIAQALKIGTGAAVIAGIIGIIYFLIQSNLIEPDFMEKATAIAKEKTFAQNPNITEEQWQQGVEMRKKFAWLTYPIILIFNTIMGLVAGLIAGLIFKKAKPAY
ncbi:DUF4199 domain-containing protein [Allomuricauda sp. SCSIO 65647]|uniref:DUF4199 domain-containing protein n=1 Tax=Allomuricauda sp. SCSIO 65647 TaxID=2908843 RepID=UPI001F24E708|nr:DUF4199 domain-containing protein [Muricauda sp. SCSIO 65647]UJH67698.1 DUF4199 domain-containing protein [Muricauda sp. SCSIO 65647]